MVGRFHSHYAEAHSDSQADLLRSLHLQIHEDTPLFIRSVDFLRWGWRNGVNLQVTRPGRNPPDLSKWR